MNDEITVKIFQMKLSGNRTEHWVRIQRAERTFDTRVYAAQHYNRALYERDMLRHVLLGSPKPNIRDKCYSDPEEKTDV